MEVMEANVEDIDKEVEAFVCAFRKKISPLLSKESLKQILKQADEARLSKEIQDLLSERDDIDAAFEIVHNMHLKILRDNGFNEEDIPRAIGEVYSARYNYRYDEDMKNFMSNLLHVKYDLTGDGPIQEGDRMKDVTLYTLNEEPVPLSNFYSSSKPLVIFAGSMT